MNSAQPSEAPGALLADATATVPGPVPVAKWRWRSTAEAIAIPVAAVLAAGLLFGLFCLVQGRNPFSVFAAIYKAAFGSGYSFQNTLVRASPLMLTALCTALPARLGLVIIGNEGALVVGGLGAVAAGLLVAGSPAPVVWAAMALAGFGVGGLWIGAAGLLHYRRGVNETISSLLMNYIAIAVMNHLVNGPMRDPASLNKPSSYPIPDDRMLPPIGETNVHYGILFGLVACVLAWFLMEQTTFGFKVRMVGGNIRAARLAGLPVSRLGWITCLLAGGAAGLAGMIEVAAVHGRANESLAAGYGYAGILVAFVARHRGLPIILVSVLLGGILASGGILQRQFQLPDATILVFQGLVFLMILLSDSMYGRFGLFKEKDAA
ncbi:MAG: ABC transporter permease [Verrucomicrobiales bacterium]|nr:ABC transporter permease [Verrucomicrobiales bacterium]